MENWRPIAGFEGFYEVSDFGRVHSLVRQTCRGRRGGKMLKPQPCGNYFLITLHRIGIKRTEYLHALVLETFVGSRPPGTEACHDPDPNPSNCRLDNLRWDTRTNNLRDKTKHGTQTRGETHPVARLKEDDIRSIFGLWRKGLTQTEIALRFNVSRSHIHLVLTRKLWRHVEIKEIAA